MSQSHETAMGIALSGGNQVQIACTPTTDSVKVQSYLYGVKQFGHQKLSNVCILPCRHFRPLPWHSNIEPIRTSHKESFVLSHLPSLKAWKNWGWFVRKSRRTISLSIWLESAIFQQDRERSCKWCMKRWGARLKIALFFLWSLKAMLVMFFSQVKFWAEMQMVLPWWSMKTMTLNSEWLWKWVWEKNRRD